MPKNDDIYHSILIVSASEQFNSIVKRSLKGSIMVDERKSAATARRCILEKYYDLVVINAPLPDESGEEFALDVTYKCNASILLVISQDLYNNIYENMVNHAIYVLPKPFPRGSVDKAVLFLLADQVKFRQLEKKVSSIEDKMEELRLVSQAKILLVENEHMSEDEAHRSIINDAMNRGLSKKRIAQSIIDKYE
ncbi:MAG: ANTAR domain-containing protein [Lachnospiraceae bacterium]|nr:ANTAR domain-containing protein [Lachnospiraceae bacterium]